MPESSCSSVIWWLVGEFHSYLLPRRKHSASQGRLRARHPVPLKYHGDAIGRGFLRNATQSHANEVRNPGTNQYTGRRRPGRGPLQKNPLVPRVGPVIRGFVGGIQRGGIGSEIRNCSNVVVVDALPLDLIASLLRAGRTAGPPP